MSKNNINLFKHGEQVRASHILISADMLQTIRENSEKAKKQNVQPLIVEETINEDDNFLSRSKILMEEAETKFQKKNLNEEKHNINDESHGKKNWAKSVNPKNNFLDILKNFCYNI